MKLLGKKLYRTRPIKLYKGGFGGGAPGTDFSIPAVNVTPQQNQPEIGTVPPEIIAPPGEEGLSVEEKVLKEFRSRAVPSDYPPPHVWAERDRSAMNQIRQRHGLPPLEIDPNSEFEFFRPGPGSTEPWNTPNEFPPGTHGNPPESSESFIEETEQESVTSPIEGLKPFQENEADEPAPGFTPPQRPVGAYDGPQWMQEGLNAEQPPQRPVVRPWDDQETFSFEELEVDTPGGLQGSPAPAPEPVEVPWKQEPQLPSLSGVWGQEEARPPLRPSDEPVHHQAPPLQAPQRPTAHIPAEGPAGEGEVQTLRQTVAELRKEIASLRQQLAAAGGGAGKPVNKPVTPQIFGLPDRESIRPGGRPTW